METRKDKSRTPASKARAIRFRTARRNKLEATK